MWRSNLFSNIPVRNPYPTELDYFSQNPHVAGMAAEDNAVILNPFSTLSPQEKASVLANERARVFMRTSGNRPQFDLTDAQKQQFGGYSKDEQDIRDTIAARIFSGDPSAGDATPEQMTWVIKNLYGPHFNKERFGLSYDANDDWGNIYQELLR